ncbi:MAG: cupin domain-containing protein [Chloroflexota bacterium]|nr:cupin domain-containing protein [Chloroflexota bacterium]
MKVRNYREVEVETIESLPGVTIRWVISEKEGAPHFAMRVFEVEPGAACPFHTHPWEHEVFILDGKGLAKGESSEVPLRERDVIFIPPDEKHQLVNDGDTILRFICLVPLVNGKRPQI